MTDSLKNYLEAEENSKRERAEYKRNLQRKKHAKLVKKMNMYRTATKYILSIIGIALLGTVLWYTFIGGMVNPPEGYEKHYITYTAVKGDTIQDISYDYLDASDIKVRQVDVEFDMVMTNHRYNHIDEGETILIPVITKIEK